MECISGLSAGLLPQREFAAHKWFYRTPLWYYHARGVNPQLKLNPVFFDLVDPSLRKLCRMLIRAGLRTTPSCEGHFYPREYFACIWAELRCEERSIRGEGLPVRDCETGETFVFCDTGYQLPWDGFPQFFGEAGREQHRGHLGVVVPPELRPIREHLLQDPYRSGAARVRLDRELSHLFGGDLFAVDVHAESPSANQREWEAITRYFREIVNVAAVPQAAGVGL